MSHDIETAAQNVEKSHSIIVEANQRIQELDIKVHQNVNDFIEAFKQKIKENRRNKVNIKNGMDEVFKIHKKAIEVQKEKIKVCKEAYDNVDKEVNEFDVKLQRYYNNKERAKSSDSSLARLAVLTRRRRKKKRRNALGPQREGKVRDSAEVEAPPVAPEFVADPSEPRYCYCQRVAFGKMVACDGEGCHFEWFHFVCVGLTDDPVAEWFCDDCKAKNEANIKRKSVSKTPKQRTVESYLSPIKKKINPRKSLSELKRENMEAQRKESISPIKEIKTPKAISPKKNIIISKTPAKSIKSQTPKKVLASAMKSPKSTLKKTGTAVARRQLFNESTTPKRRVQIENPTVSPVKIAIKPVKISINIRSPPITSSNRPSTNAKKVTPKTPPPSPKKLRSASTSLRRSSRR
uniref:Inhibitor of growth protein n=1 Tax=Panagrolaimus davidi TaxID=227884 RepID=A0A914P7G9_9BILA